MRCTTFLTHAVHTRYEVCGGIATGLGSYLEPLAGDHARPDPRATGGAARLGELPNVDGCHGAAPRVELRHSPQCTDQCALSGAVSGRVPFVSRARTCASVDSSPRSTPDSRTVNNVAAGGRAGADVGRATAALNGETGRLAGNCLYVANLGGAEVGRKPVRDRERAVVPAPPASAFAAAGPGASTDDVCSLPALAGVLGRASVSACSWTVTSVPDDHTEGAMPPKSGCFRNTENAGQLL